MPQPETEHRQRRLQRLNQFLREQQHWSRTSAYRRAARYPGLLVKLDDATLIDLDVKDAIEANLPIADIKPDVTRPAPAVPVSRAPVRRRALNPAD